MRRKILFATAAAWMTLALVPLSAFAQGQDEVAVTRGRIWEDLRNDGWIGSLSAWDFQTTMPLGFFPGFEGSAYPYGSEDKAYGPDVFTNANYHNFRSGIWIVAKALRTPGLPPQYAPTPTGYEVYLTGAQQTTYGCESNRAPIKRTENFSSRSGFNPLLPEELTEATWHTNTGITVTRRSYTWSYPGYRDFIIYDYVFKNTGIMVSAVTGSVVPNWTAETLNDVYFAFHSFVSVSTKSQINFHNTINAIQAGATGWSTTDTYHDVYHCENNGAFVYSTNVNGGYDLPSWDKQERKPVDQVRRIFGPELQSPAAFGWVMLSAPPSRNPVPRSAPNAPDYLRIDVHYGGTFKGVNYDMEHFVLGEKWGKRDFYDFVTTSDSQATLGNSGNRSNLYTQSYGPYRLAPGDSVRFIMAEIAGVMNYKEVVEGDPLNHFPDSTIAAIRQNMINAQNAVLWGKDAVEPSTGLPLAAAVPTPPPCPNTVAANASIGTDTAVIAVTWDKIAETTTLKDGAGNNFYNGATDLLGYRVYRTTDFQYTGQTSPPALRGAAWDLLADIPKAEVSKYFDEGTGKYRLLDKGVTFGYKYGYYVSAYARPASWTSPNNVTVSPLPELESGQAGMTTPTAALPGPVMSFDVFVAPNPFVYGDPTRSFAKNGNLYGIEFRNLPASCTIRIYTLSGDLVKILEHKPDESGSVFGSESWDQKTDSGLLVAPGLYVYHVKSNTDGLSAAKTGKFMIIR